MTELFFDDFTEPTASNGWVETFDVGSNFQINTVSFPEVMHVQNITGGAGIVEKWVYKDTGIVTSGDVKLEMKLDFQNQADGTSSIMFIRFAEQQVHPANMTESFIGFTIDRTVDGFHQLRGEISDGTTSITTNLGGTQQQHSIWIYANTGVQDVSGVLPASELLGPYFCTIELKDGEFRISVYNDLAKTVHIRGSPIQVSAGGVSPTNLRHIIVAGTKGGGIGRRFTGDFDDFRISTGEPLEIIPPTGLGVKNVENWESYQVGETAPDGWTSQNAITPLNGGTFSLEETKSEVSDTMPDSTTFIPDYVDVMNENTDLPFDTLLNPNAFIKKLWFANGPPLTSATCQVSPFGVGVDPRNPDASVVALTCANAFLFIDPVSEVLRFVNMRATGDPNSIGTPISRILDPLFPFKLPNATYDNFDPLKENFVVRFKMNFEQVNSSFKDADEFWVGLLEKPPTIGLDGISPTGGQQGIGIRFGIFENSSSVVFAEISMINSNGTLPLGTVPDFIFTTTYASGDTFFFQIRRFNNGTEYAVDIFQDENYSILLETATALTKFTRGSLQWFTLGGSVRTGATTGGNWTGTIDTLEVYNGVEIPLQPSTLSYQIRKKFNKDNITGTVESRSSVGGGIALPPLVPTFTTTTGGGLDIPVQMEARLKGNIVSSGTGGNPLGTTYAGIAVVYHFINGAPSTDPIGVFPTGSEKIPHQGLAHVAFKGVNTDSILPPNTIPVYVGDPVIPSRFSVVQMEVISEESNLVGNYTTIARNIKRDMNERSASFDSQGLDFDAHVTGITLIPFVITNSGELSGNVETELFADNLVLRQPTEVIFSVNAILQAFSSNAVIGLKDLTGLVAYWDFDEVTGDLINRATDIGSLQSFGTIADGVLLPNPSTSVTDIVRGVVSDKPNIGTSYRFLGDGTDNPGSSQDGNEIKVGDDSTAQKELWTFLTDARFTYNAWVEPNSGATSGGYLLFTSNNTSFNPGIQVFIAPILSPPDPPVWNLSCTLRKFLTTLASGVMIGKIKSDEKQMITITYDRNAPSPQMKFYLNGVERADGSNTGATLGTALPRFTPRLGTNPASQAGTTYNGLMDEVSVWTRVLQPTEIKQLYCVGIAEKPLAQGKQAGCITIDAFVGIFLGKEKEFGIKAKLTKDGVNEVDSIIGATLIIPVPPEFEFTVSSKIIIQGIETKDFTVSGEPIIGARINLEYTINAILVPATISLESKINAIIANRNTATFSVNKFLSSEATILQVESVF